MEPEEESYYNANVSNNRLRKETALMLAQSRHLAACEVMHKYHIKYEAATKSRDEALIEARLAYLQLHPDGDGLDYSCR